MITLRYMNRINRDAAAADFKRDGYTVRKRSNRNQVLSPNYLADLPADYPTFPSLGGSLEPSFFAAVYTLEATR